MFDDWFDYGDPERITILCRGARKLEAASPPGRGSPNKRGMEGERGKRGKSTRQQQPAHQEELSEEEIGTNRSKVGCFAQNNEFVVNIQVCCAGGVRVARHPVLHSGAARGSLQSQRQDGRVAVRGAEHAQRPGAGQRGEDWRPDMHCRDRCRSGTGPACCPVSPVRTSRAPSTSSTAGTFAGEPLQL